MSLHGVFTPLSIFGLSAVLLMILCDVMEEHHRIWKLVFVFACLMGSLYGFLQGAWPFGIAEGVWAAVKFIQFWRPIHPKET